MSTRHVHKYQKLSEQAVFCSVCGDIKQAPPPICTLPHYPTWYPYTTTPYYPVWWGTTTGGTVTYGQDTIQLGDGTSVTYTVEG